MESIFEHQANTLYATDISGTAAVKPRRNQRVNKIIEAKKRAVKVEAQAKITLNNELLVM